MMNNKYGLSKTVMGVALFGMIVLLSACGGSGSSSAPAPVPVPKAWGIASLIETDNAGNAASPRIAFDANGNALAAWSQSDGTRYNIWANRYTIGYGWGVAELIETDNTGDAEGPEIAFDSGGNALAVWYQSDGTRTNIWSNRYTRGTGWGTPALLETDNTGRAYIPQIAFDSSGNAMVLWTQSDGTRYNIWARRYTAGTGWETAVLIEADNAGDAWSPRMAFDASGNALAVWQQSDGLRNNIWSNRYAAGSGWGTAALIETENAGDADLSRIAIDASGNVLAVWRQSDGVRYNTWSNRYTAGTGWGTAVLIETDNAGDVDENSAPQLAFDSNGNALAVWSQSDGTRNNLWSNRYTAGTGWGTAVLIETDNTGAVSNPQIAIDAGGNALAVWNQSDGTRDNIMSNRYTTATGWGTAALIETYNGGYALAPQIAFDINGNAMAVWTQSDGTRTNIWANRYQ